MTGVTLPSLELQNNYNQLFCDQGLGTQVFTNQLLSLGLFRPLLTPEDVTRHNYAIQLLINTGVISPTRRSQAIENLLSGETKRAVRRILSIRVPAKEDIYDDKEKKKNER